MLQFSILITTLLLALFLHLSATALLTSLPKNLAQLNTVDKLLAYHKYPAQSFSIETADGYRLTLHRIPRPGAAPVLLMHGLLANALHWLLTWPPNNLAFVLHERGYDVWLGNARGTTYGQRHNKLEAKADDAFWKYDWHEIGLYDLPAIIDKILLESNATQLSYIGHSQGCTAFFVMAALRPEYNAKIAVMHAFTPAVYLNHTRTPLISHAVAYLQKYNYPFAKKDSSPKSYRHACLRSSFALRFCLKLGARVFGDNAENINKTVLTMLIYNFDANISVRQLAHYYQIYKTGTFAALDADFWLGAPFNATAAGYPLENVSAAVALYYCENDWLVDKQDVQHLALKLPHVVENYLVPNKKWNHLDPLWGMDAKSMLYEHLLQVQEKYVQV